MHSSGYPKDTPCALTDGSLPPSPLTQRLPDSSQRVCGAQPAVHGGSRAVRETAPAASQGVRSKARGG